MIRRSWNGLPGRLMSPGAGRSTRLHQLLNVVHIEVAADVGGVLDQVAVEGDGGVDTVDDELAQAARQRALDAIAQIEEALKGLGI